MSIQEKIIQWFSNNSSIGDDATAHTKENYLEMGYIDSFGFLELISYCEEELGVSLSDDDFSNDEIFTIDGLVNVLDAKVN